MGSGEIAVVAGTVLGILLVALVFVVVVGGFLALPLLFKKRIAAWTEGRSSTDAWTALENGATRGLLQILPARFLVEGSIPCRHPPQTAHPLVAQMFQSGFGRKLLTIDAQGVVVSRRWLPFLATDFGWVGVILIQPQGPGSLLQYRFRSTYMLPVITVFLRLYLDLGVLGPMRRM